MNQDDREDNPLWFWDTFVAKFVPYLPFVIGAIAVLVAAINHNWEWLTAFFQVL